MGQPLIKAAAENHLLERANGRLFAIAVTFAIAAVLVMCMRTQRKEPSLTRPKVSEARGG